MQNEPEVTKASVYRPPAQRNGNSGDVSKIDFYSSIFFDQVDRSHWSKFLIGQTFEIFIDL